MSTKLTMRWMKQATALGPKSHLHGRPHCLLQVVSEGIIPGPRSLDDMTAHHLNVLMIVGVQDWRHSHAAWPLEFCLGQLFLIILLDPDRETGPEFFLLAEGPVSVLQLLSGPWKALWEAQGSSSCRLPLGRVTILPEPAPWSAANISILAHSPQSFLRSLSHLPHL